MSFIAAFADELNFDPNKPWVDIKAVASNGDYATRKEVLEVPRGGHVDLFAKAYGGNKVIKKIFFILIEESEDGAIRLYEVTPKDFTKEDEKEALEGTAFVRMPAPKKLSKNLTIRVVSLVVLENGVQQDSWPMYLEFKK